MLTSSKFLALLETYANDKKIVVYGLSLTVLLCIAIMLGAFYELYRTHQLVVKRPEQTQTEPAPKEERYDMSQLAQSHLFGKALEGNSQSVAQTKLALHLVGVLSISSNEDQGSAIIATDEGDEQVFVVGELVPGGARLYKVEEKRVLLMNNDQLEALALPVLDKENSK